MVKSQLQKVTVCRAVASSEATQQAVTAVGWGFAHLPRTRVCSPSSDPHVDTAHGAMEDIFVI